MERQERGPLKGVARQVNATIELEEDQRPLLAI